MNIGFCSVKIHLHVCPQINPQVHDYFELSCHSRGGEKGNFTTYTHVRNKKKLWKSNLSSFMQWLVVYVVHLGDCKCSEKMDTCNFSFSLWFSFAYFFLVNEIQKSKVVNYSPTFLM
ncbi:hypothetical protein PIB30_038390 [Stylosanthes scabra]|uniref:S-protein homolog n=1 Tax=Stylosanthes scabra TaxID=79078 RepID=A0ABU6SDW8_9FABA|nr:hypothetical protein [Stylosanthes scabra]